MDIQRCYEVLGIPYGSSLEKIKEAYRVKVKFYHPDKFQDDKKQQEHAEKMMKEVNDAYKVLCEFIANNGTPPKQEKQKEKGNKYNQEDTSDDFRQTDTGNAKRLVSLHGSEIKYAGGSWYVWSGKLWEQDSGKIKIMRMAKDTANSLFTKSKKDENQNRSAKLKQWAARSEAENKLNAMINLTASEPGISISTGQFDANKWLLNIENGTINLKTGECSSHIKEDLITKISSVKYSKDAQCPEWQRFIASVTGENKNLQKFLKRIIGYALTGDTREQCLFFLYGKGANGKSTFLEVIRALLGDYAQQTDFTTFLSKNDTVRNDLARLKGARFVSGVEAAEGKQFAEVFLKRVTGGDKITARYLYKEYFEFEPTFKIFLAANHRPVISGTDHAIWRRIHLIPFSVTFDDRKKIKGFAQKLKAELSGILNWAIEGCREWLEEGLNPPEEIINATQNYRKEMDVIGNFLEECCKVKAGARVAKGEMYYFYCKWCGSNDENAIGKKVFGQKMKERGTEETHSGDVRYWIGIELQSDIRNYSNAITNDTGQSFQENTASGDYHEDYSAYLEELDGCSIPGEEIEEDDESEPFVLTQKEIAGTNHNETINGNSIDDFTQEEINELREAGYRLFHNIKTARIKDKKN